MICSWSLAYDVLNGTLDENFPPMNSFSTAEEGAEWVKKNGGYEYTPTPDPNDHNDPRNYPPLISANPSTPYIYESPDGGKTVTRRRAWFFR